MNNQVSKTDKILIGCEESQTICNAFRSAGYEAYSCDLEPTRGGNPQWHFQKDIMKIIPTKKWDLIILHPDCSAMALSGNRWYGRNMPKNYKRHTAIEWTLKLWELAKKHGKKVALENPKSVIFPKLKALGADVQYIQPWMFGHKENKETGFALHNLPRLKETSNVKKWVDMMPSRETDKVHRMPPGPNRKRDRSITYLGIAEAIVNQW